MSTAIRKLVKPYTLVGPERMESLLDLSRRIEEELVPGDVVECGVYNGGTAALMARTATHSRFGRRLWLFDSFEGMPETTEIDGRPAQDYVGKVVGDPAAVREILEKAGADLRRVRIVKGWFEETLPSANIESIALLNIDADWYESVRRVLETFYDAVAPGGYVSIDDYGHWPGCKKAVDEFFESRNLRPELHAVDYTARWFRKEA